MQFSIVYINVYQWAVFSIFYFYFKFRFISDLVSKVGLLISVLVMFLEVSLLVLLFYCLARIH